MKGAFSIAFHPVPEPEEYDTGLRFTDVLFGFVIRELFLRLQNWAHLDSAVRLHLIVGTTLVLGSWIGFRRSLYRSSYQLKFFNLPLLRFLVDQLMLIFYFRIAVLTPAPTDIGRIAFPTTGDLVRSTSWLVMCVFILYAIWDWLGIWMLKTKVTGADRNKKPRYPVVKDKKMTAIEQPVNWLGSLITLVSMVALVVLWCLSDCLTPMPLFLTTTAVLLMYRWLKEIRTSWQLQSKT